VAGTAARSEPEEGPAGCAAGQAVKLTSSGANNAFIAGPLKGVTLWVDAGPTLYASRATSLFGSGCGCGSILCRAEFDRGSGNALERRAL